MKARDLMRREVFTIRQDEPVEALIEMLVREHIHGVPVVDSDGVVVGVVTQQDVFFSTTTLGCSGEQGTAADLTVREIMTSPAVTASPDTELRGLCQLMTRLRIHRVPILDDGRLAGMVSALDVCGAVARGRRLA